MKKGFDCEHCGNTGMCMSLAEKTKIDWPAMLDEDGKCRMYKEGGCFMFRRITDKSEYIRSADVERLPISYGGKIERHLFGKPVLLENDPWLWHLHLKLTNVCNAACKFCVEQNSRCQEDNKAFLRSVDRMLGEMEREGILHSVSVTGGEPLLFGRFDDLCDILASHDIKFLTINTNARFLQNSLNRICGLFDFVDISRHAVSDKRNNEIFRTEMPTLQELKQIKSDMAGTKMRIQCVMYDMESVTHVLRFIAAFSFADDLSFRRLMRLSEKHGIYYDEKADLYQKVLDYAYKNFEFVEQTIQDYYVYEIWNNSGTNITFSYSNMRMLYETEGKEPDSVCREFIIHPDGTVSGSWDCTKKVILSS